MKLARDAAPPDAVRRLIELMDSRDERVSVVACNSLLDRAFGKPKVAEERKDSMEARLANMTREERLAEMRRLLEPMRQYLPAAPNNGGYHHGPRPEYWETGTISASARQRVPRAGSLTPGAHSDPPGEPLIGCRCGRRAAKLYGAPVFACRDCCGLVYSSQREIPRHRAIRRAQKARMRLGGSANLLEPFPKKPRGMHRRTYYRLSARAMAAQERSIALELAYIHRRLLPRVPAKGS